MHAIPPMKGDVLTEEGLDHAVHAVQFEALHRGMIPIAGVMSRRREDGKHVVLGSGWNHLAEGIPGIHGETGAVMNTGRLDGGWGDVVATSSLNPCPFCQRTLARHLGVREVRILDVENYAPDLTSYPSTLKPVVCPHPKTAATFKTWVKDPAHARLWERDIGLWDRPHAGVFDVGSAPARLKALSALAHQKAREGLEAGEAPVGALVLDAEGEVIGAGHPRIVMDNDPTAVAAMTAWRACGARDHWRDKTLLLTSGCDHIGYSMFKIFNFGQLVVMSDAVHAGETAAVKGLGGPHSVCNDACADEMLKMWMARMPEELVKEYFGADWSRARCGW